MPDTGLPPQNPWQDYEPQPKVEVIQDTSKLQSNIPEHIQVQVDEVMQESRERKEKELKVESVFQALEEKFWNQFDRSKFSITISWLWERDLNYLWYWVFLLHSKDWKLLSYIKDNWDTIIDMTNFNPYLDSFEKNMMNHIWITMWIWEDWKWFLNDESWITKEGEEEFDRYIISKYVLKK